MFPNPVTDNKINIKLFENPTTPVDVTIYSMEGAKVYYNRFTQAGSVISFKVPTFTANAGTQNFTSTYYKKRSANGIPLPPQLVTETGKRFQLLSFEASVPIVYVYKKLALSFTPGYVIPQNIIKVAGRPDLSENASNLFYANVGVFFTFKKK